jgi:hypothetical protein
MRCSLLTTILLGLVVSTSATAGTFSVRCYTNIQCANALTEIVSDKFTTKFPSKSWEIFVTTDFLKYSNGGGVGFAIAGIVPKNSNQMPLHRFSSTMRIDASRSVLASEIDSLKIEIMQNAVRDLMAECERGNCDVYTVQK